MMRSLFAGISGLRNHQTRMDVIGNNIANVNTTGFKAGRVQFQDVLSQTMQGPTAGVDGRGGTNPMQVGLGMGLASIDTIFTDGNFQPTGVQTDLSIQGQGFFVLSDGLSNVYTRAGNFDFDDQGNFIVPGTGYMVQGWTADADGKLLATGDPGPIQLPVGTSMKPKASESMTFGNNLMATTALGESITESLNVFDSLGIAHKVEATFTRIGDKQWLYSMDVPDASTGTLTNRLGEITFKDNGQIESIFTADPTTPAIPTATAGIAVGDGFKLDSTSDSVFTKSITVFDSNGNRREFNMEFTANTAGDAWTYQITESGSASVLKTGTATWDGAEYDFTDGATPADTTLNFTVSGTPASTVAVTFGTQTAPTAAASNFTFTAPTVPTTSNTLTLSSAANSVYTTPITVFDNNGQPRVFNMEFTANDTASEWSYKITESGVANPTTVKSGTVSLNGTGYLFKDSTGAIDPAGLNFIFDGGPTTVVSIPGVPGTAGFAYDPYTKVPQAAMTFTPTGGAAPVSLTLRMDNLTQFGSATTMKILDQDGYSSGQLEAKVIDINGVITARYSNNQTRVLGQVALATFNNPGGLTKSGESLFITSSSSGEPQIGTAGTGGRGSLNPGSLEMSNVDLAQEFSNMIITQRGFQANSKMITTTDEMLQEIANLKR